MGGGVVLLLLCSFWLIVEKTGVGYKSNTGDKASLWEPAAALLLTAQKILGFPSLLRSAPGEGGGPKRMPQVEENVYAVQPIGERQEENSPAPPKMFKIVKMCKLRWEVLLVEAPEGQRYPFGLERCLSVNAIKKPAQQLKSPRRWSALLPPSPKNKVLECECNPIAGDPPAVSHPGLRRPTVHPPAVHPPEVRPPAVCPCPGGGDVEDTVSLLGSNGSPCCETRNSRPLLQSVERCSKHGGPLGSPLLSPFGAPQTLVSSTGDHGDVAQVEFTPRKHCYATVSHGGIGSSGGNIDGSNNGGSNNSGSSGGGSSNSHQKAKKATSSEQRVQTPVQQQRLAKRGSLHTALPLSSKIKLLSKERETAMKAKTDFRELKTVQTFYSKKGPKCPFCYQHHE